MRYLLLVVLVLFLGLCARYFLWQHSSPQHHIDREHFRQLKVGMTERDIVATLGVQPGNYARNRFGPAPVDDGEWFPVDAEERFEGSVLKEWETDDVALQVVFTAEGQARFFNLQMFSPQEPSILWKVLSWLGLKTTPQLGC